MTHRRVLLFVLAASLTSCKSLTAPAAAAVVSLPSTPDRHLVTIPGDGVTLGWCREGAGSTYAEELSIRR
jgi:hypothetical protein